MKIKKRLCDCLFIVPFVLILTGCYATSVYPFYRPSDMAFEKDLLGTWHDDKKDGVTVFIRQGPKDDNYFIVHFTQGKSLVYTGQLFDLNKSKFMDITPYNKFPKNPSQEDTNFLLTHSVWKIILHGDQMQFLMIQEKKLRELADRANARYLVVDGNIVLTGTSEEVQDLISLHLDELFPTDDTNLFKRETK
jgi:hypothetical protein